MKLIVKDVKKNGITPNALLPCERCRSATFHMYKGHRKPSSLAQEHEVIMKCGVCNSSRVWGVEEAGNR